MSRRDRAKPRPPSRAGVTLVELIVVVAVIGIAAGVAGVAFRTRKVGPAAVTEAAARVAQARADALASGRAVTVEIPTGDRLATATAYPDGSVVADSALRVDRLTGRAGDARR